MTATTETQAPWIAVTVNHAGGIEMTYMADGVGQVVVPAESFFAVRGAQIRAGIARVALDAPASVAFRDVTPHPETYLADGWEVSPV